MALTLYVSVLLAMLAAMLPIVTPAEAPVPQFDHENYRFFDIKKSLVLSCNTTEDLKWYKNNTLVSEDPNLDNRYKIIDVEKKFIIERSVQNDAGTYTCKAASGEATIIAVAKPTARLPPNTSVVEGEKLRLQCVVAGMPTPTVQWFYDDKHIELDGRFTLLNENGIVNSVLVLENVTKDDRGTYECQAKNVANKFMNTTSDSTFVRVKDSLAALWPFLGICAEVFVLCAIILIYEKRRNKPEMDESDTDQSPDQKHTPDHGKDVRQRK